MRDQLGRKIHAPDNPRHVVALSPSITEIIFALEQQKRLAGTTQFNNFPAVASQLPKVGPYVRLDLERIAALNPDSLHRAIKDGNPKHVVERLQAPPGNYSPKRLARVAAYVPQGLPIVFPFTVEETVLLGNVS
jgi:iron complex transport system substrate-binding protein